MYSYMPDLYRKIASTALALCMTAVLLCIDSGNAVFADKQNLPASPKEPVVVNGDKVEYFHDQKKVVGVGNVSIEYKDVLLTCDKITVYLDTREGIAEGNVKIAQKGAFLTGEKMNYNFDTRQGSVINGYLNANPFYGKAKEVSKVANKDQYNMDYGYATTCDLDKPHYRIQAKKVKIYLGDKVVAHHIFLFAGNVPILYFPYYVQPLNERKSHITVMPGESKEWGYYALTSYRYYLDDQNKGDLLLDYRSKNGLAVGVNHYYTVPGLGNGAFKFYYTRANNGFAYEPVGQEEDRYRYQVRHDWDIGGDTDTRVTFELNKLSDPDVIKYYFYNEYEELGTDPDNYLSILTQKREYSAEFLVRTRLNDFQDVVERLPEYKFDIPNLRLSKDYPIYYKLNSSAAYLNRASSNLVIPTPKDVGAGRVDAYNQLSYAARVFNSLNLTPYVGVEETYYSRNRWGDTNLVRGIFKTGVDASIKFYKIYNVTTNAMGLDINNLRHVITPTAGYFYVHQPTISPDNLTQFDEIDAQTAANGVSLGLENRLQTKRMTNGQMRSVDLATLLITTDWNFTLNKDNTSFKRNKLENIDFLLEIVPYSWAYMVGEMMVNTKTSSVETASLDLVGVGGERWNFSAGYRWENVPTGLVNLFTMDGTYKINEKWKVRAYERFNIENGAFEEQEYTVSRDLHCWIAEFTYNYRNDGNQSLWFVMKLKAFPNYPIGLKRTYTRPRFGSNALMQ
jgi:LPS-assembly protein